MKTAFRSLQHWVLSILVIASGTCSNAALAQSVDARGFPLAEQITVSDIVLVATRRVSRFDFEFDYQVTATNNGDTRLAVIGEATSANPSVTVVGVDLSSERVESAQDIEGLLTVSHNRRQRFSPQDIQLQFFGAEATGVPSDPGNEGTETIEGVDSDGDGIRDDLEVSAALLFPSESFERVSVLAAIAVVQEMIVRSSNESNATILQEHLQTRRCLAEIGGTDLEDRYLELQVKAINTTERVVAFENFLASISGVSWSVPNPLTDNNCAIEVTP